MGEDGDDVGGINFAPIFCKLGNWDKQVRRSDWPLSMTEDYTEKKMCDINTYVY